MNFGLALLGISLKGLKSSMDLSVEKELSSKKTLPTTNILKADIENYPNLNVSGIVMHIEDAWKAYRLEQRKCRPWKAGHLATFREPHHWVGKYPIDTHFEIEPPALVNISYQDFRMHLEASIKSLGPERNNVEKLASHIWARLKPQETIG